MKCECNSPRICGVQLEFFLKQSSYCFSFVMIKIFGTGNFSLLYLLIFLYRVLFRTKTIFAFQVNAMYRKLKNNAKFYCFFGMFIKQVAVGYFI